MVDNKERHRTEGSAFGAFERSLPLQKKERFLQQLGRPTQQATTYASGPQE